MKALRVIISGGGTGGHIFPAIAIAKAIQRAQPNAEILFVGAEGKMEMEKVPQAGYTIIGLPIVGIQRKLTLKNLLVPFKIIQSMSKAKRVIKDFQPDIAIGVGGYASGPLLRAAANQGIPTFLQEQNSYPGITNKILAKKAHKICVAYDGLDQFFPKEKIVLTGNPIREEVTQLEGKKQQAIKHFGLDENKKTVLVVGGSLGARTINQAIDAAKNQLAENGLQVLWQTGKNYSVDRSLLPPSVHVHTFIKEMDYAYAAADFIVSSAGAMSISELCLVGKPVILVPSPNVSEDHQTKHAMALVNKGAAVLVKDSEAIAQLPIAITQLVNDTTKCESLGRTILTLGKAGAADHIAKEAIAVASRR